MTMKKHESVQRLKYKEQMSKSLLHESSSDNSSENEKKETEDFLIKSFG